MDSVEIPEFWQNVRAGISMGISLLFWIWIFIETRQAAKRLKREKRLRQEIREIWKNFR